MPFTADAVTAFLQVIVIDLVLAGDNAIVIGLAAAGLPDRQRAQAVLVGIVVAAAVRLAFAIVATHLLQVAGLALAGGVLLFWVSWRMLRELRHPFEADIEELPETVLQAATLPSAAGKTLPQAVGQIIIADVSMSLDNVLAVAGAAKEHTVVLVFGLAVSIALMGLAASLIARMLQTYRWIAYIGLAMIIYVAASMTWRGTGEIVMLLDI